MVSGASNQIRTGDLVLTKDARCRLRHGSISIFYALYLILTKDVLCHLSYNSVFSNPYYLQFIFYTLRAAFVKCSLAASVRGPAANYGGFTTGISPASVEHQIHIAPHTRRKPSCPQSRRHTERIRVICAGRERNELPHAREARGQ